MHFFKRKPASTVTPVIVVDAPINNSRPAYIGSRPVSVLSKASHQSLVVYESEQVIIPEKTNCCRQCCSKENLKEQALLIATVTAVALGVIVGISLRGLKCRGGKEDHPSSISVLDRRL